MRTRQLCGLKFRRQHPIGPFIADFACAARALVVELDGDVHDTRGEHDVERERFLHRLGWDVVRFSNDDVLRDIDAVVVAIATRLGLNTQVVRRVTGRSGMFGGPTE